MDAAFWNNRFAVPQYIYGETPNVFVAEMASKIPVGPVLCLAEGEGRNAVHLATLGHRVTAVDQSQAGLAKARQLAAARGVEIETVHADLVNYTIAPGVWAGIVATFAHLAARNSIQGPCSDGARSAARRSVYSGSLYPGAIGVRHRRTKIPGTTHDSGRPA